MDICIVNPKHYGTVDGFPWGVLSVATHLVRRGRQVTLLDASLYSDAAFKDLLHEALKKTRFLALGCFSTDAAWVKALVEQARAARPDLFILLGGPHPTLLPDQTMAYQGVDAITYGMGEEAADALIDKVKASEADLSDVPGIMWRKDGEVVKNPAATQVHFDDTCYDLFPADKQARYSRYMEVLVGKGCSFRCAFCYNNVCGHKWVGRPAEDFCAEIEKLVSAYNPAHIYFRDENFFHSKKRVRRFIELYREKGFTFTWDSTCRANYFSDSYVNAAFLKELESVNCVQLKFGIESGNQRVLDFLKKDIKLEQIRRVVTSLAASSIKGNYSFLMGIPEESYAEYADTMALIRFIHQTDPTAHVIGPQYFRVYPGGELYDHIMANYDYPMPDSFEAWAKTVEDDDLGLNKNLDHPWIDRKRSLLARHADMLVLLYRKPLKDLLSLRKLPALPLALMARLRMRALWFTHMYEMRAADFMFRKYIEMFYKVH